MTPETKDQIMDETLAALKRLVEYYDHGESEPGCAECFELDAAKAAIAKAEGRVT